MPTIAQPEIATQRRVINYFTNTLNYQYLGNLHDNPTTPNIDDHRLRAWLTSQGHDELTITRALGNLTRANAITATRDLYDTNRAVYELLRYGVKVKPTVGEKSITVPLIDWQTPTANHFAIAEEVTVKGATQTRRPDVVLYINGIAVAVLELKRSTVALSEGIRQHLSSQSKDFIPHFYTTVQLVLAGNDSEGLRYGVIQTPEKYFLEWKEPDPEPNPLLRALGQLCRPGRLLEIIHDFMVFDAGIKKTCRHNQYFGVRAAQPHIQRREGGIIWHTQGSGKSLTMVWLAKWIREQSAEHRVLLITDRTELDEQIEKVFLGVDEQIYRTSSSADLIHTLNSDTEWLICTLVHKFAKGGEDTATEDFIQELRQHLPPNFRARGNITVFVDECHRTQSGKLHQAMKTLLPDAIFIGFTGTPLLKTDKQTSVETFGGWIHQYKYDQAVRDGVVLDLRYEARDIDQTLESPELVDQWFAAKTQGLSDLGKAELKKRWGTMQKLLSAADRLRKIVADILMDMAQRDRLRSGHGNALLVADSIYSACRFYKHFQDTELRGRCAVVTSYQPNPADIKAENSGTGDTENRVQYDIYRRMLADWFNEPADRAMYKVEQFEKQVKQRFIHEPARMKLLIVVDKLLTGFDAPPATYLYIDKSMRDHGLFQAICRVNRLHTPDKEYGYIVDYKDLFKSLEQSVKDYTSNAFEGYDKTDVEDLLKDRLAEGHRRLEEVRETLKALCEPVLPPRDIPAHVRFFCGPGGDAEALKANEQKRLTLYQQVASLVRAHANLANEMSAAGYSQAEAGTIRAEVADFEAIREAVKLASGDYVDLKLWEPAMRHLLDTYIRASDSERISAFDELSLVDLIIRDGPEKATEQLPSGLRQDQEAMAETIDNNVRRLIIDETPTNPRYYDHLSTLLDDLIEQRRRQALSYQEYLEKIHHLARQARHPGDDPDTAPPGIDTPARRALYDNLRDVTSVLERFTPRDHVAEGNPVARAAVALDEAVRAVKQHGWRGNRMRERAIQNAIRQTLGNDETLLNTLFNIIKSRDDY